MNNGFLNILLTSLVNVQQTEEIILRAFSIFYEICRIIFNRIAYESSIKAFLSL